MLGFFLGLHFILKTPNHLADVQQMAERERMLAAVLLHSHFENASEDSKLVLHKIESAKT